MTGYVDLHVHYVPNVDDGVRSYEEGAAICDALSKLGYDLIVATPHIRGGMFENDPASLRTAHVAFAERYARESCAAPRPALGLGAEHHVDDLVWGLFTKNELLAYPGGQAVLVEFPSERLPLHVDRRLFDLQRKGLTPVLAHPERYTPFFKDSKQLGPLVELGAAPLLDLMSLVGHYGRSPRDAAFRLLDERRYAAACTDCHRPEDAEKVAAAIEELRGRVGTDQLHLLLADNPRRLLEGTYEPRSYDEG